MKLFTGWVISAGLVLVATAANAQVLAPYEIGRSPYTAVSDVGGPYAGMPPEAQRPRYDVPRYGPALLPPAEVYTIVRESGFSPLGIPQQRGLFYTISVIDRGGDDGRLVIDARTGRIIRFMPAYRMGDNFNDDLTVTYGPVGSLPPMNNMRATPRPPGSVPRVASRTPLMPLPKAPPPHAVDIKPEAKPLAAKPADKPVADKPVADKPVADKSVADKPTADKSASDKPASTAAEKPASEPAQKSAAMQAPETPVKPPSAVPIVEAKPAPQVKPTQEMPKALGLD